MVIFYPFFFFSAFNEMVAETLVKKKKKDKKTDEVSTRFRLEGDIGMKWKNQV